MEIFSVGRNTVREAVQSLVAMGVLDVRPGRGATVLSASLDGTLDTTTVSALLDDQTIADLYEFRLLIEGEIAALAAQRTTEDDLEQIEKWLNRFREAFERSLPTIEADIEFHRAIAKASENVIYIRVLDAISDLLTSVRRSTEALPWAKAEALEDHTEVCQAIAAHDAERARDAMRRHILHAIHAVQEMQRLAQARRPAKPKPAATSRRGTDRERT